MSVLSAATCSGKTFCRIHIKSGWYVGSNANDQVLFVNATDCECIFREANDMAEYFLCP